MSHQRSRCTMSVGEGSSRIRRVVGMYIWELSSTLCWGRRRHIGVKLMNFDGEMARRSSVLPLKLGGPLSIIGWERHVFGFFFFLSSWVSARLAGLSAPLLHDLLPKVVKMVEGEDGASAEPNHHGAICLMKNCQKAASSITWLDPLHYIRFLQILLSLLQLLYWTCIIHLSRI